MLKKIISNLFPKKKIEQESNFIVVQLNEKVMPIDRGIVYEDPIDEFLKERNWGEVTGGGTLQEKTGELSYCDIEIQLSTNSINKSIIAEIIERLENIGAPKGSKIIIEKTNEEIPFGKKEGLALYIDGQNLPKEVYEQSDINFVLSEIHRLTNIEPNADRFWEGEKETALYFYGQSFEQMKNQISELLETYPLCKGARVVQIA
ncbi:MAG: hypothetical protein JST07_02570 [Bacteroidetes bacterium]|nr:hypothetical protein [Bacteroidota bacterium]